MNTEELAHTIMQGVIYGGDMISRCEPFDEEKHYGDWTKDFVKELDKILPIVGEDFFNEDMIELLTDGDYDCVQKVIKENPCLDNLNDLMNDYFDWLCEEFD